jgi:hypothetical protein
LDQTLRLRNLMAHSSAALKAKSRAGTQPHCVATTGAGATKVTTAMRESAAAAVRAPAGFRHFVTSMPAPVASGWSGCRAGLAPAGKRRLCTAHAICRRCGRAASGRLNTIAVHLEAPVIEKILTQLGLPARALPRTPAHGQTLQAA